MMAKMFYTADETRQVLGRSEEEISQLSREGKLREFRDGSRVMYKADQVEALKAELGIDGGEPDLGPSDTGGPLGLADSANPAATRGGTTGGSMIGLADSIPPTMLSKDDTATDLGGSAPGGIGASASGINVLGLDEGGADPSAQTAVSQSYGDQVNLEAMGSGSGLLDLSRERDDTSLGAPVLGEIESGGSGVGPAPVAPAGMPALPRGMPIYVEPADPWANAIGWACLGAAITAGVGVLALAAGSTNQPVPIAFLSQENGEAQPIWFLGGIGAGLSVVLLVIGFLVSKKK